MKYLGKGGFVSVKKKTVFKFFSSHIIVDKYHILVDRNNTTITSQKFGIIKLLHHSRSQWCNYHITVDGNVTTITSQ